MLISIRSFRAAGLRRTLATRVCGYKFLDKFLRLLIEHTRGLTFVEHLLQPGLFIRCSVLVPSHKVADEVAGAAVAAFGNAVIDPGLKSRWN